MADRLGSGSGGGWFIPFLDGGLLFQQLHPFPAFLVLVLGDQLLEDVVAHFVKRTGGRRPVHCARCRPK